MNGQEDLHSPFALLLSPFALLLSYPWSCLTIFSYLNSPRFLHLFHFLFSSSSIERNGMWFHSFQSYYYFFLFQEVFSREWDWSGMKAHLSFFYFLTTSSLKKLLHLRTWSFFSSLSDFNDCLTFIFLFFIRTFPSPSSHIYVSPW